MIEIAVVAGVVPVTLEHGYSPPFAFGFCCFSLHLAAVAYPLIFLEQTTTAKNKIGSLCRKPIFYSKGIGLRFIYHAKNQPSV